MPSDPIKAEIKRERRRQAKKAMPLLGPLLDAWDALSADAINDLEQESASFVRQMERLQEVMDDA